MLSFISKALDVVIGTFSDRRRVRFRTHIAVFGGSDVPQVFLNLTNLSTRRGIEVTHVWVEGDSQQIPAIRSERPLPKHLDPDESWETWIALADIPEPARVDVLRRGRARLSTGRTVRSRPDPGVPSMGSVPGGSAPEA